MVIKARETKVKAGYKQTEVGVIPEEWEVTPLTGLAIIQHGYGFESQYFKPFGKYRLTTPGHFYETGGFRDVGEKQKFYEGPLPEGYLLAEGDLIVAMTEQADGLLGSAAIVPIGNTYLHNQRLGKVKVLSPNLSLRFLYRVFNSNNYRAKVRETAAGTKVKHTSPSKLLEIPIPLPSTKAEQEAIATALSEVDALLTSLDKLIDKKRDIKQATMQQLLTGKMRLPGFSGEWEVKKLEDECELITKGTTPTSLGKNFSAHGINFIKVESLTEEGNIVQDKLAFIDVETHKLLRRSQLKNKDILFSIAGALGRTTIVKQNVLPANINQALALIRLKDRSCLDHIFLTKYLTSPEITRHIGLINVQVAQANLSLEDVRNFEIRVPANSEQTAIATILSDMDAEIAALEQKREKTRALKQGMMQELLSGRIRLL